MSSLWMALVLSIVLVFKVLSNRVDVPLLDVTVITLKSALNWRTQQNAVFVCPLITGEPQEATNIVR